MAGTLYTYADNFRAQRILIAAKMSNQELKVPQEPEFVYGESNKSANFLKKFPLGRVPALETKDGLVLFETNAIVDYIASDQLRGAGNATTRAQVRQWVDYADNTLLQPVMTLFFQGTGLVASAPAKDVVEHARGNMKQQLQLLDQALNGRTTLVGDQITLADIAVFSVLKEAYKTVVPTQMRQQYKNVWKWFENMASQQAVEAVVGKLQLCETEPASLREHKVSEGSGDNKQQQQKADGGQKKEKAAAAASQQGEKPKAKPKAAAKESDAEEEPEDEYKERPSNDPLAALPAGTLNLEDFKRFFSNNPPEKVSAYFWEKFDAANYSIWYCEYLFPKELGMTFMSANLVGGMFQRLEKLHKYAFSSMAVWGKNGDNQISGIWVWRGQDLVFPLSADWQIDYESFKWEKLDPTSDKTKQLVDQYMKQDGERDGKPYADGKVYK